MSLLSAPAVIRSAAARLADQCIAANRAALDQIQPDLLASLPPLPDQLEFVTGRDGSRTARCRGQWISGCSLPQRTARHLLRTLDLSGAVACFLNPTHAAQLRAALDRLSDWQAIIALVPDEADLHLMLHCEDFSADLVRHRLWFASGAQWPQRLSQLLEDHPGLPTPAQFIRTPLTDSEQMQQRITEAQRIFSAESQRRSVLAAELGRQWRPGTARRGWCVVAGSRFKLWQGAPAILWEQLQRGNGAAVRYDPDHPSSGSPIALLQSAIECGGVVAADLGRGDFLGLLPIEMPWVSWITTPRLPSPAAAGPHDCLLLADPQWMDHARQAGWAPEKLGIALWPSMTNDQQPTANGSLALLVDTHPVDPEPNMDLSSHRLLWQAIAGEIAADPFCLAQDAHAFLHERRNRMNISEEGFDAGRFINHLILPAYQQALARLLLQNSLPLRVAGNGWDRMEEFKPLWSGTLKTPEEFASAVREANVLVHAWPTPAWRHEIDALNRPVLRPPGRRRESYVQAARQLMGASATPPSSAGHPILSSECLPQDPPQQA
jgi:hypothetical protein